MNNEWIHVSLNFDFSLVFPSISENSTPNWIMQDMAEKDVESISKNIENLINNTEIILQGDVFCGIRHKLDPNKEHFSKFNKSEEKVFHIDDSKLFLTRPLSKIFHSKASCNMDSTTQTLMSVFNIRISPELEEAYSLEDLYYDNIALFQIIESIKINYPNITMEGLSGEVNIPNRVNCVAGIVDNSICITEIDNYMKITYKVEDRLKYNKEILNDEKNKIVFPNDIFNILHNIELEGNNEFIKSVKNLPIYKELISNNKKPFWKFW